MGELFHYALRLTPYPNNDQKVAFCKERIDGFIKAIQGVDYLYGQEYEKNHHFHIVFSTYQEIPKKGDRIDFVKDTLYTTFEVPEKKIGNPSYSLEPVRSLNEALCYAVKEGKYNCSDGWRELCAEAYENSFEKKYSMKSSLEDLTDKYMKGDINDRQLWVGLGQSRAELGLPLSIRWINEMLLSLQCKKDPNKLNEIWEDIEIKKNIGN